LTTRKVKATKRPSRLSDTSTLPIQVRQLGRLVGSWEVTISWSEATHKLVGGPREVELPVEIKWVDIGPWIYYRFGPARWLIGGDEDSKEFAVLYTDDRPAPREYRMTLDGDTWRIWRDTPGFRQRFEGRLTNNDSRIVAHWDKCEDGKSWMLDFNLVFARKKSSGR
jgi:hypothetical protein